MDRAILVARFERLLGLRGNPVHGLDAVAWAECLEGIEPALVLRAAIAAVRELLIPEWADRRRADRRPQLALEAAEAWLAQPSDEVIALAKAASKACTAARNEFFGDDHRVPEAARSIARVPTAKDSTPLFEALACVEEELLTRIALMGEYHRGPEQRRAIVDVLRRMLLPPEPAADATAPKADDGAPPVPYSADGHFVLGQRLAHKKFGEIAVTSVGETWIEVTLPDGSKKRLAHAP